jgi:hypothetical protein
MDDGNFEEMKMVRSTTMVAVLLGGLICCDLPAVLAQETTTRPAHEFRSRPHDNPRDGARGRGGPREGGRDEGRPGGFRFVPPSDEEWKLVEAFAAEYSPNRLAVLNKMRDAHEPGYRIAQAFLVSRYRATASMKEHDPDLYAARVEGVKLEDSVFGAVEAGDGAADAPAEKKAALRENVTKLVASNLQERERRIARMAEILADQKRQLDADKANQEQLVDDKMNDIQRDGVKSLMPGTKFQKRRGQRNPAGQDRPLNAEDAPAPAENPPPAPAPER